jgi:uncharacterized protein involved in exopolysaccharide biosynthesis
LVEEGANVEEEREYGGTRDFLTILFKHKSKILIIFFAVVLTVAIGSFLMAPTYEAKSTLLVKIGREYMYRPEVGTGTQISVSPPNQEEIVNSELQVLENRELMEKVIRTIGVENLYPTLAKRTYSDGVTPVDMAVIAFGKDLTVEGVKKSNVIEVSYRNKDRQMAAKALNLLVELFKEKHLQVYNDPKSSFLEQQLDEYREKLKGSEEGLQQFKQQNRVYALDEQRNLLLQQRVNADTTYKEALNSTAELRQRLSTLNEKAHTMSENLPLYTVSERDRAITDAKAKLFDLQMKEQELLTKYKEDNFRVVDVRKEVATAQRFVTEQEEDVKAAVRTGNPVFQEIEKERIKTEADLKAQQAKSESLKHQLVMMDAEISKLDLAEKKFVDLKRGFVVNEKNYQNYVDKSEDARISDDMNRRKLANISTIQAASVPVKPIKPRKGLNIALSIVLGAVAGLGFAFFSEYSSQGLASPEAAERRLKLNVLATVSKEKAA